MDPIPIMNANVLLNGSSSSLDPSFDCSFFDFVDRLIASSLIAGNPVFKREEIN